MNNFGRPRLRASFLLAVVLVLVVVLILVIVLILVVLVHLLVLILVLVIHDRSSKILYSRRAAPIDCPIFQDLSFALNKRLASRPATTAAVIPPAQAFSPPVKIPRKPSS